MKIIIILTLLASKAFSLDCSYKNKFYESLEFDWFELVHYRVESSVKNINGLFCIAFSKDKKIEKVYYSDDAGNLILKEANDLFKKDVIFFSKRVLPSVAQAITRSADPLSLHIQKQDDSKYLINIKYVENMMRGFSRTNIRLVPAIVDFSSSKPVVYINNKEVDEIFLKVNNTLHINYLGTLYRGVPVENIFSSKFKLTNRN